MIRGGRRQWRRVGGLLFCGLAMLGPLIGCGLGKPNEEEQPPPPRDAEGTPEGPDGEPMPEVQLGSEATSIAIRDPKGGVIWEVEGELRSAVAGETGVVELLDAHATSKIPGYHAELTAGRLRYRLGENFLLVDRRIFVGAPDRHADLEAEAARFEFETNQFIVDRTARLRTPEAVVECDGVTAIVDLREATFTHPTAHERAATPSWHLTAKSGHIDAHGVAVFDEVTGHVVRDGVTTKFGAPKAAWKPVQRWLNFNDGAEFQRSDFTLSAAALTWQQADNRIVTHGATTLTRDNLTVTGHGGTVDVTARTGSLTSITATGPQMTLHATRGDVTSSGTVRLSGLTGTVDGQTTITASSAIYEPGAKRLVLPNGGTARRAGASVRAGHVVFEAGANRFRATGGVTLTESQGAVSGDTLSGPGDLSSATLTPLTASGRQAGQAWRLNASSGTWHRGGAVTLSRTTGTITFRGRTVHASSGSVRHEPAAQRIVFEDGFRAESPEDHVTVTANRAIYSLSTKTFRAIGNVTARARGVAVKNGGEWTYHVGADADQSLLSSGQPSKPRAPQPRAPQPRAPQPGKKEASPSPAKEPVTEPPAAGEGASEGATGPSDRTGPSDDQGSELRGSDASDA